MAIFLFFTLQTPETPWLVGVQYSMIKGLVS